MANCGYDDNGLPTFDLVGGILGRTDDMVVVRVLNEHPSAIDSVINRFPEIKEYQVCFEYIDSMLEVKVRIECDKEIASWLKVFAAKLSLRIPVELVESGSLPRSGYEGKSMD